jgi:hypothetical protein
MESIVSEGIAAIAQFIGEYVGPLVAAGALTMALIEAFKQLFSVRGRFHRNSLRRWLGILTAQRHYAGQLPASYKASEALGELIELTTGQSPSDKPTRIRFRNLSNSLYELELAKMMSQIQDACDAVLQNPERYQNLYAFFTRDCAATDASERSKYMGKSNNGKPTELDARKASEVMSRLHLLTRRRLDAFQSVTAFRWDEWNKAWAFILGALILFVAQSVALGDSLVTSNSTTPIGAAWDGLWESISEGSWFTMVLYSLLGGALAPIAKDLVSVLTDLTVSKKIR